MKLKLLISILLLVCGIVMTVFAQDIIFLKTGDEIKSDVIEVDIEYIKYKKFENLTGPIYTLEKSKIFMIKYENGTKDVFGEQPEQKKETPLAFDTTKAPASTTQQNNQTTNLIISGYVSDFDGKLYKTIKIGTSVWMAENLAYKANSGCWAYNDDMANVAKYGYLYEWGTAKTVCPSGWHLPGDAEWKTLLTALGGEKTAGSKLKETGTSHWQSPNTGVTNESGFTALPGGFRNGFGVYSGMGGYGLWWSSSWYNTFNGHYLLLNYENNKAIQRDLPKISGFSVRCIQD